MEALHIWLAETYPRFHAAAPRTVVGEGTLIYEWAGRDAQLQPIILMAHQDAVPAAEPERWKHPPFSGAIAEGAIWGRGALDNKSALIAIMEAAESLVIAGHAPERTVFFVSGHDEESGGAGARAAAELLANRGVRAAFVLDEGGVSLNADAPGNETAVDTLARALIAIREHLLLGPADITLAHGLNERTSLDNFERMLTFYQQVIVGGSARELP